MKLITDMKRLNHIKIMIGMMIGILVISLTSILLYTSLVNVIKQTQNDSVKELKEQKFEEIYSYYLNLEYKASRIANSVAKNIEQDIRSTMDLNVLKEELDAGSMNEELQDIFIDNIIGRDLNNIDNHKNGIVILSNNKIEQDLNYTRANREVRDLKTEREHNYNKQLFDDAINKLLNHSNAMISLEYEEPKDDNHITIDEMNKENLKKVYMAEGIEGLRGYQFAAASYITDEGDIFGQDDIVHGILQSNHKFIIIQEFNLYDQIHAHRNSILNDDNIDIVLLHYQEITNVLNLLGIMFILNIVIIVVFFLLMYNNFIFGYMKAYNNKTPDIK